MTIGDRTPAPEDAVEVLGQWLDSLPVFIREKSRHAIGTYRGLRFGLAVDPHGTPDLYLEGAALRQSMLPRESHGPRAILNALERLAGAYDSNAPGSAKTTSGDVVQAGVGAAAGKRLLRHLQNALAVPQRVGTTRVFPVSLRV